MKDYPNLRGLSMGTMSGHVCGWPQLKKEAGQILTDISALETQLSQLQSHADKIGEYLDGATKKRIELEYTIEHLETQIKEKDERIGELEERQKWINEVGRPKHPDDERPWVPAYLDCRTRIKSLEDGIEIALKKMSDRESYVLLGRAYIAPIERDLKKLIEKK